MQIRSDRKKGLSYAEISRKYNVDPRTAIRYAEAENKPVYELSEPKPSKLNPINIRLICGWKKRLTAQ